MAEEGSATRSATKSVATTSQATAGGGSGGGGPDLDGPCPFPDYSNLGSEKTSSRPTTTTPHRSPWLFRATLDIQLPFTSSSSKPTKPIPAPRSGSSSGNQGSGIRTQIWSDEEAGSAAGPHANGSNNAPSEHGSSGSAVVVQTQVRRSSENLGEEK